jgi:hypothetical protein
MDALPDDLMAVVAASPAAVAAHDKQRWLELWSANYVIEDPVGSRPVRAGERDRRSGGQIGRSGGQIGRSGGQSNGPLSRFWDSFIAANDVVFDVHHDFIDGARIVRDVTVRTTLPSGVHAVTPAHLVYDLVVEAGTVKIQRMAAHWEVAPVFAQLIKPTVPHLRALASSNVRMLRYLGVGATIRFVGAIRSVGQSGKRAVLDAVTRAAQGDPDAAALVGARVPGDLTKVIASGDTVTASCTVDAAPAVVVAALNRRTRQIVSFDLYDRQFRGPAI